MKDNEKQLQFFLNYSYSYSDIFVRANAILWFQTKFMNYWMTEDEINGTNYKRIIEELYLNKNIVSLKKVAIAVGLHVRTLNRYREKFLKKMNDLIVEYQNTMFSKITNKNL